MCLDFLFKQGPFWPLCCCFEFVRPFGRARDGTLITPVKSVVTSQVLCHVFAYLELGFLDLDTIGK